MKMPKRIILIDDDSITNLYCNYVIREALKTRKHLAGSKEEIAARDAEVITFAIPQKALNYINTEYAANAISTIIFLDINMPVLSGWDVLDELKKSVPSIKSNISVFMLSSSVDPNDKMKAKEFDMVKGFCEKPLTIEAFQSICEIN